MSETQSLEDRIRHLIVRSLELGLEPAALGLEADLKDDVGVDSAALLELVSELDANGIERLLVVDLDNDGRLDVLGYGGERLTFWRNSDDGLQLATTEFGLDQTTAAAVTAIDFDIEGDLDFFTAGGAAASTEAVSGPLRPI